MINVTSQYVTQTFLPYAYASLQTQINTANSSRVTTLKFPMKLGRANAGSAPDNSGAIMTQIDVYFNSNAFYAFQNFAVGQQYALQAANEVVNNASYYIENNQASNINNGYYQILVWGAV